MTATATKLDQETTFGLSLTQLLTEYGIEKVLFEFDQECYGQEESVEIDQVEYTTEEFELLWGDTDTDNWDNLLYQLKDLFYTEVLPELQALHSGYINIASIFCSLGKEGKPVFWGEASYNHKVATY